MTIVFPFRNFFLSFTYLPSKYFSIDSLPFPWKYIPVLYQYSEYL